MTQTLEQTAEPVTETADPGTALALVIERLACNPEVDVLKLEKIIELQERILKHQSKAAFDAAFAEMQGELPVITERGEIVVEGQIRSTYARYEDIQAAVKPILQRHGFALRHRNQPLANGVLQIVGILSHKGGWSEEDGFECPADSSGKKNSIQAIGSTRSYGMRYTTIALLNLELRGGDDDGQAAGSTVSDVPVPPAGYAEWALDLAAVADNGWPALSAAWKASKPEYREYAGRYQAEEWKAVRAKATQVQA